LRAPPPYNRTMAFKRRGEPATIEDEREALRAQRAAVEDMKRQLAERVDAVRERELELHHALAEANRAQPEPRHGSRALPPESVVDADAETALEAQRRERALAEREQALVAREQAAVAAAARLAEREREIERRAAQERNGAEADTGEDALEAERRERALVERERAVIAGEALLAERERGLLAAPEAAPPPAAKEDAARLEQIETRLAELRDAEKMFLRTRDELAARSEAVAARERLIAQKERELDDREDGVGQWANPELTEMEARLRRLEQGQAGEQTLGFSGGLRKLQQGTTRSQREG